MLRTLALALSLAAVAETASAQGFLERMAKQAAQAAAEKAASAAMGKLSGQLGSGETDGQAAAPAAARRADAPAEVLTPKPRAGTARAAPDRAAAAAAVQASPSGPAPWPVNVGSPDVKRPGDLEFSAETKALATAFDAFGRVSCSSCEGGRSYDSWARKSLGISSERNAWETKLGSLGLGETLNWTGVESKGRITVVGETPVGGFRCKQLKWELFKGSARAERPGLVCFGYSGPFAASESWNEVV